MVDCQKLLVLITNATLMSPQLLVQGIMLLGHMPDLLLKEFDLPCISIETTTLSHNGVLGVVLESEQVLGISHHIRPTTMVVVLKDVAHLINVHLPLRDQSGPGSGTMRSVCPWCQAGAASIVR
jgi:hypothetical protein